MFEAITDYFKSIFATLFSVGGAMFIGLKNWTRPEITTQYPRERWDIPDGSRMKLYNNIDDCIGCYKCSRICPTDCIEIETVKAPNDVDLGKASTGNPLNFWVTKFDIDMVKCCYCDLCTTVCPTECLVMTKAYEGSAYDRGNLIYHFSNIDSEKMEEINALLEEDEKEEEQQETTTGGAAAAEGGTKTITKIVSEKPEEELTTNERIELRLIRRGKLDSDSTDLALKEVEEEVTVEEPAQTTTAPEETKEASPPAEDKPEEAEAASEESASSEPADAGSEKTAETDEGGDDSGYVLDESKPVMDRIRERLEMRGKL